MNEFVLIFRHSENSHANPTAEQLQERMNWLANVAAGNHLGDKGNSLSAINAKTVRPDMVTDGPYTEIKEFVSGYMIVVGEIGGAVEVGISVRSYYVSFYLQVEVPHIEGIDILRTKLETLFVGKTSPVVMKHFFRHKLINQQLPIELN